MLHIFCETPARGIHTLYTAMSSKATKIPSVESNVGCYENQNQENYVHHVLCAFDKYAGSDMVSSSLYSPSGNVQTHKCNPFDALLL